MSDLPKRGSSPWNTPTELVSVDTDRMLENLKHRRRLKKLAFRRIVGAAGMTGLVVLLVVGVNWSQNQKPEMTAEQNLQDSGSSPQSFEGEGAIGANHKVARNQIEAMNAVMISSEEKWSALAKSVAQSFDTQQRLHELRSEQNELRDQLRHQQMLIAREKLSRSLISQN